MEPEPQNATAITIAGAPAKSPPPLLPLPMKKKKQRSFRFIRTMLYLLNGGSDSNNNNKTSSSKSAVVSSTELLNKVVGTMRPLHAPKCCGSPYRPEQIPSPDDVIGMEFCASPSPSSSSSLKPSSSYASFTSEEVTTQYGSSLNLLDLDNDDSDDDVDGSGTTFDGGDEMIDVKAEEFIARFYQQMRIQN